jgi:hypothetical protein
MAHGTRGNLPEQAEHTNPTSNRPGATQASRRNLCQRSPSHLHPLSTVIERVSELMVATQQVKCYITIYMQALNTISFYSRKHPIRKVHLL